VRFSLNSSCLEACCQLLLMTLKASEPRCWTRMEDFCDLARPPVPDVLYEIKIIYHVWNRDNFCSSYQTQRKKPRAKFQTRHLTIKHTQAKSFIYYLVVM